MFGKAALEQLKGQYEARITDLQKQVEDLRSLIFSPTSSTNIPLVSLEADAVMSGKDDIIYIESSSEEIEAEAGRILSGNY